MTTTGIEGEQTEARETARPTKSTTVGSLDVLVALLVAAGITVALSGAHELGKRQGREEAKSRTILYCTGLIDGYVAKLKKAPA